MRVGGSRVIFTVDNANRTIIIDKIALHHDGYKK
jgi:mRNA-degrading endonuclease RelE of RelBE toxin-antitoxin system